MLVRLAFVSAALLISTAPVLAADGCPSGTFSITTPVAVNGATTVAFDIFEAEAGDFSGVSSATSRCDLTVPVKDQSGFSVFNLNYLGFVIAADGHTVTVINNVNGQRIFVVQGPSGDPLVGDVLAGSTPGNDLAISTTLNVATNGNPGDTLAGIDAIDISRIGFTTEAEVQGSIDQLATQQGGLVPHLASASNLLLGALQPIGGGTQASGLAAFGSSLVGGTGTFDVGNGFSLLGGAAVFDQANAGVQSSGLLAAGAGRYVHPLQPGIDVFAEGGAYGSPNLDLQFSRTYQNVRFGVADPTVTAIGNTAGSLASLYARAGIIYMPVPDHQIVFSATLARNWLAVGGYTESSANGNLFAATVAPSFHTTDMVKATLAWTGKLTPELDVTLSGGIGQSFGAANAVNANIAFAGNFSAPLPNQTFFEYGARLGWKFSPTATLDGFVYGVTGPGMGTETRFGGALSVDF